MPTERMDSQGLSPSSFFSEQLQFADERPLGLWKRNAVPNYGMPSSPLGKQTTLEAPIGKNLEFLDPHFNQDLGAAKHVGGVMGAASRSLPRAFNHELGARPGFGVGPVSYSMKGDKLDLVGAQRENDLFSSSLSELFSRKMRLSSNNAVYGHSIGSVAPQFEEEETYGSLKELEAQTIGNLLPNDDDDDFLPSGTQGIGHIITSYNGDETEDLDVFSNVGGMDLGDDKYNRGTVAVLNLDSSVTSEELRQLFGVYGEIKEIRETPHRSDRRFIEFYDVRAAEAAICALNRSEIAGKRIKLEPPSSTINTGLSGAFSQTSSVHEKSIYSIHSASGFVDNSFNQAISSSVPNTLPSPIRVGSVGHQSSFNEFGQSQQGGRKFDFNGVPNFLPHSGPDFQNRWNNVNNGFSCNSPNRSNSSSLTALPSNIIDKQQFCRVNSNGSSLELNESVFGLGNGSCPPTRHHPMWNSTHYTQPQVMMSPNSPSFVNDIFTPHPQQLHAVPRSPNQLLTLPVPLTNHHIGSSPSLNPSLWDRRHAYPSESGSLENSRVSGSSTIPLEYFPNNMFTDLTVPSKNVPFISNPQMVFNGRGQMIPVMNAIDSPNERTRNRRNGSVSSQVENKRQFELDIERIARGDDKRTTLMIKNIPNKYTSKLLLAAIDERHRGIYDFIYLPIDFKNKCNVGYAFINMIGPSYVIPFYQAFNGKKWEKFNSEKVAIIAYARIQGKAALIAHFQNSSLMNEDKRCRPILFHTDGPNAGDQVAFPMGGNIRPRYGKSRGSTSEDNSQEREESD